jgi:hypothetical protein
VNRINPLGCHSHEGEPIENTKGFEWNDVEIPEEPERRGRIWRMITLEECRLRLLANLDSESRGGQSGRCRGGVNAPLSSKSSMAAILSDCPAAVYGVIVRGNWNVPDPRMASAGVPVEIQMTSYPPRRGERPVKKKRRTKPTVKFVTSDQIMS